MGTFLENHRQQDYECLGAGSICTSTPGQDAVVARIASGFDSRNRLASKSDGGSVMRESHNALPNTHWTNLPYEILLS